MNQEFNDDSSGDDAIIEAVVNQHQQRLHGVAAFVQAATYVVFPAEDGVDHRTLPRGERTVFQNEQALYCIRRDYLGFPDQPDFVPVISRFDFKYFQVMFRVTIRRFQRLMEDFGNSQIKYYQTMPGNHASLEAKLLLPLKTIAYGVPPHCFMDYFQMSKQHARDCVMNFCSGMLQLYQQEYLKSPTSEDVKNICKLHEHVHGVPGMLGSIDCMHTWWKNCPVAWQGQYKGKGDFPTIVLEAISDYHTYFWHASFGHAGTLNDLNILALSPFMDMILDGTLEELEKSVTPYNIATEEFNKVYVLADGIYPSHTRFAKGFKSPLTQAEKRYTAWQEGARKDIERAFGNLQNKCQCTQRGFYEMDLEKIRHKMATSLILHNMGVVDRVMGGAPRSVYNPAYNIDLETDDNISYPTDLQQVLAENNVPTNNQHQSQRMLQNCNNTVRAWLNKQHERAAALMDEEEYKRLINALITLKSQRSNT